MFIKYFLSPHLKHFHCMDRKVKFLKIFRSSQNESSTFLINQRRKIQVSGDIIRYRHKERCDKNTDKILFCFFNFFINLTLQFCHGIKLRFKLRNMANSTTALQKTYSTTLFFQTFKLSVFHGQSLQLPMIFFFYYSAMANVFKYCFILDF